VASDVTLNTDLIPMDVFLDMTLNDVRAIVEDEFKVPAISQVFFHNNVPLTDNSKTLAELNITEGDMLGLAIQNPGDDSRRKRPQEEGSSSQRQQRPRGGPDPERFRLHLVEDPRMLEEVRSRDPELANAANYPDRFHAVWDQRQRTLAQAQAEREEQLELLNADPFNVEAQAKIEEAIRQERVQENAQKALEENPECEHPLPFIF
jgi:DNA damage-inducible protein 1